MAMRKRVKTLICLLVLTTAALLLIKLCHFLRNSMCFLPGIIPSVFPQLESRDNTNVTVVTAFFNLGTFQKGDQPLHRQSFRDYLRWAKVLLRLQNPLVVFTDFREMANLFRSSFSGKDLKVVFVSNRSSFSAFRQLPRISEILARPNYPKFHPNTVVPEYSCSQHAKMDVMEEALAWDVFHTKYFAWVDMGYFRHLHFRKKKFWISAPPDLDDQKMAACETRSPKFALSVNDIFRKNEHWIGGGMFLGTRGTYSRFVAEYRRAMAHFLAAGLVNTDQQVLYAMFKPSVKEWFNVTTQLQLFRWYGSWVFSNCWFYLGYHCYREQ